MRKAYRCLLVSALVAGSNLLAKAETPDDGKVVAVLPLDLLDARFEKADGAVLDENLRAATADALEPFDYRATASATTYGMLAKNRVDLNQRCGSKCQFERARMLNAPYFITGMVSSRGDQHQAFFRLYDSRSGSRLSSTCINGADTKDILDQFKAQAPALVAKLASGNDASPRPYPTQPVAGIFQAAGLEWQSENLPDAMPLHKGHAYCEGLSLSGHGWRIPTKNELIALFRAFESDERPARADLEMSFWSSTPLTDDSAWGVSLHDGCMTRIETRKYISNVRCVRGPSTVAPPPIAGIDTRIEPKSGLEFAHLPGGTFHFGGEPNDGPHCGKPEPSVPGPNTTVEPMWMGRTPVTVAAYAKCVDAGVCSDDAKTAAWRGSESGKGGFSEWCTYGKAGFDQYPVTCLSWTDADTFCHWIGGRLPTAEEWEYAAKSGESRSYPWGSDPPTGQLANFCDSRCIQAEAFRGTLGADDGWVHVAPVGTFPKGATKHGLLDMAGNAYQWTSGACEGKACGGRLSSGKEKRGGSWRSPASGIRSSARDFESPVSREFDATVRCVL